MTVPIEQVIEALNAAQVRYLVVGGVAVVLHGHLRATADLDLVVKLDKPNVLAALAALQSLGLRPHAPVDPRLFADPAERARWLQDKGLTVFSLWSPTYVGLEVDLFVQEPFDFDAVDARAVGAPLDSTVARVIGLWDLIELKRQAGRPQDLIDVEALELIAQAQGLRDD